MMFSLENNCPHFSDFPTYPHLTTLNLSNLKLTRIDLFPFEHFPNLRSLDLSSNQLTFINPDWASSFENSIEDLNLSHNQLDTLLFLKDFKHLKTLNITDNLLENHERVSSLHICPTIENLIEDFDRSMTIQEKPKCHFQPIKFLRCHHQSNDDLITTSVHMCAFEPNTINPILATCGGQKVCFIDCHSCEITHLFEMSTLHSKKTKEYFSCLCWIEIEGLKILAVGATNGHIYLLSSKHKLMFGQIELPASSISCLTWHANNPFTLAIGSNHTVRFISIRSYFDRLQSFLRKQTKPTVTFDYDDSSMFIQKVSTTRVYNLYEGVGPLIRITDLLFYQSSNEKLILLVGTTSGLFVINHENQSPIQLAFPKSIWTISEYIESLQSVNSPSNLIAMNILHLDQIYFFDLEQSLQNQQLKISFTLTNPSRQIPTKFALFQSECLIGSNHGSFYYQSTATKQIEIPWPQTYTSPPCILSASLNQQYACLTTNNNLICIYKRQ